MKPIILFLSTFVISLFVYAQKPTNRFSLEGSYGATGNFFVTGLDNTGRFTTFDTYLNKKQFIGPVGGLDMLYRVSSKSSIGIFWARGVNSERKNHFDTVNQVEISITQFSVRHTNAFYGLNYRWDVRHRPKSNIFVETGLNLLYSRQQTIEVYADPRPNILSYIDINESGYKGNNSAEGGTFLGFGWSRQIDTKFRLGLRGRVFYLISTGTFEAINLTPTLSYQF